MRIRTTASLGAAILLLLTPAAASAHAQLLSSAPAADATLTEPPATITLTFDDELTAASSFDVVDASGTTLATGAVDSADPKAMVVATPALPTATYEVRWTAGTADGHIERGTFKFSLSVATPTAPAPTATGRDGTSESSAAVLAPMIAVAVLVIGGLAFFLRRRGAA